MAQTTTSIQLLSLIHTEYIIVQITQLSLTYNKNKVNNNSSILIIIYLNNNI
jgi:hypothetical protein